MVCWQISARRPKDPNSRPIPSWVTKSKEFKLEFKRQSSQFEWHLMDPFFAHKKYKQLIRVVAAE
eukprot:4572462-Karenia_brevis.AAC.1